MAWASRKRIQQLTRLHEVDLLVTDEIRHLLDERFDGRAMVPTLVKGKAEPIQIWCVEGQLKAAP